MKTRSLTTLLLAGMIGIYSCKEELVGASTLPPEGSVNIFITDSLGNTHEITNIPVSRAVSMKNITWPMPLSQLNFHSVLHDVEIDENLTFDNLTSTIEAYQPYDSSLDTFFFTSTSTITANLFTLEELDGSEYNDLDSLESQVIKIFFKSDDCSPLQDSVMVNFTYIGEPFYGEQYGARHRLREYHFNYEFPALYPGLGTYTLRYEVEAVFRRNIKDE